MGVVCIFTTQAKGIYRHNLECCSSLAMVAPYQSEWFYVSPWIGSLSQACLSSCHICDLKVFPLLSEALS